MKILGQDKNRKLLKIAIDQNLPTLLVGETGTGKTSLIRELAQAQKQQLIRFNMTGETSIDEFVGKYTLSDNRTVWEDGVLLQAIKRGHWLVVDEVNVALPEILFVLHSLLDDEKAVMVASHDGEVVEAHPNFRFFATMNPVEEYAGTKDLNKAFASRFAMTLEVKYPEPKTEVKIVRERVELSEEDASKIVDVGVAIRQAKKDGKLFYTCSTRDLLHWAALVPQIGLQDAFDVAIVGKSLTEAAELQAIYEQVIGRYNKLLVHEEPIIDWINASLNKIDKKTDEIRKEVLADIYAKLNNKETKA